MNPVPWLWALLACSSGGGSPAPCGVDHGEFWQTDDGATIHLHRHAAEGPPVLVVHGISSNHYCWDLDARRSVGVALAEAGFDTWLLDLRGHGEALHPPEGGRLRGRWSMDDYGIHDIPAAIAGIRERTGADRVGYVGHSMGGMVGAIYATRMGDDALFAMVTVGSPVDFRDPDPLLFAGRSTFDWGGSLLPTVHTPLLAWTMNHTTERWDLLPEEMLYHPPNIEREAALRMMDRVVSPLWSGEMKHFSRILEEERFVSHDATFDYASALARVEVPLLAIAGRADRVVPPDRVRPWMDLVGSEDRRFVVAGRENGFQHDYGHLDLPLGDHVRTEIYPLVISWLRDHAPGSP